MKSLQTLPFRLGSAKTMFEEHGNVEVPASIIGLVGTVLLGLIGALVKALKRSDRVQRPIPINGSEQSLRDLLSQIQQEIRRDNQELDDRMDAFEVRLKRYQERLLSVETGNRGGD